MFKMQINIVNTMVDEAKSEYFKEKISQADGDQRAIFKIVEKLIHSKGRLLLPTCNSMKSLCERFGNFFVTKIQKIRDYLDTVDTHMYEPGDIYGGEKLETFVPASEEEIRKIITKSSNASCDLDAIPTSLLKEHIDILLPVITRIINTSLESGTFPSDLKRALVKPLLKKQGLDCF